MKIMFVTHSMRFGGAERVMSLLSNEAVKRDNEIVLTIMDSEKILAYSLDDKIKIEFMPTPRFNKLGNLKKLINELREIILRHSPDVIVSFWNFALTYSWLATKGLGIPLVFSERNDPNNNIKGFKSKLFQHFALKKSNHIVFQTEGARSYYGKKIHKKSTVIINPFSVSNLPKAIDGERTKTIVSVGRFNAQKNQKLLIEAFSIVEKNHPEYRLVIYGEGSLRGSLESLICEKGLSDKVFLPGADSNVLDKINSAAMFAFSSDFEGLPNALIEAMMLGLPCISTDCSPGGARELIDNYKNGIIVPCGDFNAMADAIEYVISNPDAASAMGNEAKKLSLRTSVEHVFDEWYNIFEREFK